MEVKTIKDILELHNKFVQKAQKQIELAHEAKAPSAEVLVREKEEFLGRFKERLETAAVAKKQAILRYDEEIRRCEGTISRLKKEIQEDRKSLERAAGEATKQRKAKEEKKRVSGRKKKGKQSKKAIK